MGRLRPLGTVAAAYALATLFALTFTAESSLAAQSGQPPLTFSGQCQLSGAVAFTPPLTSTPGPVTNQASATGTCSGSLIERSGKTIQLSNAPVQYQATEVGTQESCASNPNAPGSGALTFEQGTLGFQILENRVVGTADLSLSGDRGGSASAIANANSPNPPGVLEQCAGSGVTSTPVDLMIQTTPSISG